MKIALLTVAAFLMLVGTAEAVNWYLPYGKINNQAHQEAKETCLEDVSCTAWAAKCERLNRRRINCTEASWDTYPETPGEELFCYIVAKFGVGPGGYITRHYSEPACEWVPAEV